MRMKYWIAGVFLVTLFCGLVYVSAQQALRTSANDPQVELAENTARAFTQGQQSVEALSVRNKTEMDLSLSTYLIVYDIKGKVLFSSVSLRGNTPALPKGVLNDASKKNELRFTWQPEEGVRSATVVTRFSGKQSGYVLVGRSLRETEKRVDNLFNLVLFFWIAGIAIVSLPFLFWKNKK